MLICASCGKVIADVDPYNVRYGGCGVCAIQDVKKAKEEMDNNLKQEEVK